MSIKVIVGLLLTAFTLSLVPLALIARSRSRPSPNRAIHLVLDMDKQQRFDPQANNPMFEDGRAMRPQIEGTFAIEDFSLPNEVFIVADGGPRMVGGLHTPITFNSPEEYAAIMFGRIRTPGMSDEAFKADAPPKDDKDTKPFYVADIPPQVLRMGIASGNDMFLKDFVERGRERFNINCMPCHGAAGFGDGMVARRAQAVAIANPDYISLWTPPANLTADKIRKQPAGKIFNTITNGQAGMPSYDKQISVPDRWAIVMYVRALQLSQQPLDETKTAPNK